MIYLLKTRIGIPPILSILQNTALLQMINMCRFKLSFECLAEKPDMQSRAVPEDTGTYLLYHEISFSVNQIFPYSAF
jgi:hypothetical protein